MRRRLLLILFVTLTACLGSECSGSGSGNSVAAASAQTASVGTGEEIGDDTGFVAPVPEPSAALVFGVGLLIAGAVSRRNR